MGACPVAPASQPCDTRRPNGPGNTPGSGSRRRHFPQEALLRQEQNFCGQRPNPEFGLSRRPETGARKSSVEKAALTPALLTKSLGSEIGETAWWRTQSKSNPSPLPNSLLTGKLTGNYVEFARLMRFRSPTREQIQRLATKFPTQQNSEFLRRNREFARENREFGPATGHDFRMMFSEGTGGRSERAGDAYDALVSLALHFDRLRRADNRRDAGCNHTRRRPGRWCRLCHVRAGR